MVRKTTPKTKILSSLVFSFIIVAVFASNNSAHATCYVNNGVPECDDGANFQVKIPEILTVQITRPNTWATGNVGELLRNIITLDVVSNNPAGFAASMTSSSTTAAGAALSNGSSNSSTTIPMLTSDWINGSSISTAFWGYSLDDSSETGTYSGIALKDAATPTSLIPAGTMSSASKTIYFGAAADSSIDSGTYSGTVIISVVSGTITEDNPITPTDPATKDDTTTNNPAYDQTSDRTVHTDTTYDGTENTSRIEVSEGDTRSSY